MKCRIPFLYFLIFVFAALPAHAEGVVASTSWAAAMARAAGATEVRVIAPEGLQHPPDYDPKPSDLVAIRQAQVVVLGGFEGFAAKLLEAAGSSAQVVRLHLSYDPHTVETEVLRLGGILGTSPAAQAFVAQWRTEVAATQARLRHLAQGRTCIAHVFFTPWAELAGLTVRDTFGPKPLSIPQLGRLAALHPEFILDNAHMPQAQALAEATGARRIVLANFPGPGQSLLDVLRANAAALERALQD